MEVERGYPGEVRFIPEDWFPDAGAVFTDGSVAQRGGAAAVQPVEGMVRACQVPAPRSSTHCELVALSLALAMEPTPPQVLTDSLVSLRLLAQWGAWPTRRTLGSVDRVEARRLIHLARGLPLAPCLVKVKAHDAEGIRIGHPRALGNELADQWAKRAASGGDFPMWSAGHGEHGDPVELLDAQGRVVGAVRGALAEVWWLRRHRSQAKARPWLEQLYHEEKPLDWGLSTA